MVRGGTNVREVWRLTFTLDSIRHRGEESGPWKQSHDALTTNARQHDGRTATGLNPSTGHRSGRRRAIRIGLGTRVTEGNVAQDDPSRAARALLSLPLFFPLSLSLGLSLVPSRSRPPDKVLRRRRGARDRNEAISRMRRTRARHQAHEGGNGGRGGRAGERLSRSRGGLRPAVLERGLGERVR